jgi:hypothetical protein
MDHLIKNKLVTEDCFKVHSQQIDCQIRRYIVLKCLHVFLDNKHIQRTDIQNSDDLVRVLSMIGQESRMLAEKVKAL